MNVPYVNTIPGAEKALSEGWSVAVMVVPIVTATFKTRIPVKDNKENAYFIYCHPDGLAPFLANNFNAKQVADSPNGFPCLMVDETYFSLVYRWLRDH